MKELDNVAKTMSSREIAELTGKDHRNVLADCDKLNESYQKLGLAEISAGVYIHPQNKQQHREFELTRMQTFDLMTGYSIELRIKVNRRWEELESNKLSIDDISRKDLAKMLLESEEEKERLAAEKQQLRLDGEKKDRMLESQRPKVIFADSVEVSKTSILIGELAKILKQNGIEIGQNRLFEWLRKNGYLINRNGSDYNMPTQRSMELGIFEIKETAITHSSGQVSISKTAKVNGKGQIYFVNKFLAEKETSVSQ